ncbi:MAG: ABC transporter permease [Clostridia bacterium]|nr:ABC transporter permease [Clostridia bacterium]
MKYFKNLVKPYVLWSSVMIIIPLFVMLLYAVTNSGNSLVNIQFTFENFKRFAEPVYLNVFVKSLKLGIITVAICLVVGYTLAYIIAQFKERTQTVLILLVTIPMWINMLLRTYAWISILSDNGIINTFLEKLGLSPISMMYTDFAVMIGQICDFLPYMIIPIHTSLSKMDKSYTEAAYDLGANPVQTFFKVTFKLSIPGVLNGVIMVFLLSISTFVIPKLLGGGQYVLMGNLIENQFISVGDWNFGSAISILLASIILLAIRWMKKIDTGENSQK